MEEHDPGPGGPDLPGSPTGSGRDDAARVADELRLRIHRHARGDLPHRMLEQRNELVAFKRRAFAGRSRHDEAARSTAQLMIDQPGPGIEVERIVLATERRGERT